MNIALLCNEVYGGWTFSDPFLRGSEEFIVETARALRDMGHQVRVFHNGKHGNDNGIAYQSRESYAGGFDLAIICKDIAALQHKNKKTVYYTNDIGDKDRKIPCEIIVAISNYHKENFLPQATHVMSHAIHPHKGDRVKQRGLCVYSSSPDRGLDELKRHWAQIKQQIPEARLEICYDGRSEQEMIELYDKAEFWLHPCTGVELFCIAGVKAQAAGCIPVYYPVMALTETVADGIATTPENFVDDFVHVYNNTDQKRKIVDNLVHKKYKTHHDIAAELLSL